MNVRPSQATKRKNARAAPIPLFDEDDADERQEMSPTSKRQKVVPEKRLRRYRSSMTNAIRDRIDRALHQRLYLLAATKSPNDSIYREYQVLGQTANVYTVTISHLPSCTCKSRTSVRVRGDDDFCRRSRPCQRIPVQTYHIRPSSCFESSSPFAIALPTSPTDQWTEWNIHSCWCPRTRFKYLAWTISTKKKTRQSDDA